VTDARTAAVLCIYTDDWTFRARALVDLLSAVDDAYSALTVAYGDVPEPPVDPLMLNEDDFADAAALRDVVAGLRDADALPASPGAGDASAAVRSLQVDQVERARPVYVEVSGGPPLLVALWLLTGLDGEYKVTEEYAVGTPDRQDVHKRVSFSTSAPVGDLADALRAWPA